MNVGAGEMVAIMGPSGCGKSTMLHMMGCLDEPDSGEIWLNGRRVDDLSTRATTKLLREEIGFIFQGFNLVSTMTALDNVALAAQYAGKSRRDAQKAAREALEAVGLADRAAHRPSELSGGQQQRVAIARALVNRPAVIMGDEPTGNLDTASSAEVIDMMREINLLTGTTFILVTHDPDVADGLRPGDPHARRRRHRRHGPDLVRRGARRRRPRTRGSGLNANGSEEVSVMDRRVWYTRGIAATVLPLIVALFAITSAGCGSAAEAASGPLKLGEADNGKAYTVQVGDTIEVIIPGNMTTGFSWAAALAEKDAALVQLVGEPVYATDSTAVGGGGTFTLTFKAMAKGEALLKLVYARPWESVAPEKTFGATVTVE